MFAGFYFGYLIGFEATHKSGLWFKLSVIISMKSQRVACRANVETGKEGEEKGGGLERKEKGRRFFSLFPFSFIAPPPPLFTPATQVK